MEAVYRLAHRFLKSVFTVVLSLDQSTEDDDLDGDA
jgi:hypothetical protein